jgi:hypothetical protein
VGFPSQRGEILLRERSSPMGETRRKFDADFREGAVRLVRETGKPVAQVARDLIVILSFLADHGVDLRVCVGDSVAVVAVGPC